MPLQLPGLIIGGVWNGREVLLTSNIFVRFPGPSLPGVALPGPSLVFLGQTESSMYWRWIVPLSDAQMGLGALGKCRCRAEEQTADHIPAFCPLYHPPNRTLVWQLSMMTLWTGFKQQNCASDNKIGPNEEEG